MKKLAVCVLTMTLIMSSMVTAFAGVNFSDIKTSNWAYQYVNKLVEKGGIKGYRDGTFKPSNTITVAEFVKTIMAIIDSELPSTESDKHWASGYMFAATDIFEIVPKDMFERADWDKPITREKMGVIMEMVAQKFYEESTVTDASQLSKIQAGIKDYDKICTYCKDYIVQAVSRGLITGYADGTFGPQKTATRAEAATMIVRLVEPVYRSLQSEAEQVASDVVKEGTNLADILTRELIVDKGFGDYAKSYVVLKNADRFHLRYLYSNDENFYVEYKFFGKVYTLDKDMMLIDGSSPTNDWGTEANPGVQTQAFNGKLKDTAYFIFEQVDEKVYENTIYLVPNTLTE